MGSETYGLIQNPHHPEYHAQRQIIQHQDIYQKGHKLHRLNENYYEYDKAGRLVTKVEKRDGFRKQETDYRWNGKNELIGITTPKGEVWHYKYDALGRRISKECPQQHLRIEYLWEGDQLAFTRTFKNDELVSERHSIFNGFELIAQQDHYQQLKQTIDGNIVEWKQETGYAICQPNGQVLALLNPQGRTLWRKEKHSLWGLLFPNDYRKTTPLDPQMLFAGQWLDTESGLAYNRFRYYDPESGNYLSSDPIGLLGGEIPYGYVFNPIDWLDPLGLHLNSNNSKGNFGVYEIKVNGELYKYGKTDLNRVTKSSGLPTRLHQQVRKLGNIYGKQNVEQKVIEKGIKTTELAKQMETNKLNNFYSKYGEIPLGNQKSYKPKISLEPVVKKCKG
ncbi:RHS repeat domain-containing protein [Pelistega ratti]|uniref:RHS repeat domain-containing protein n=1 Tax=Pelistega ratti TaxID=2652177 RepID=UPI001357BCFE|nr:RHS repeat-associated core domain-containing protein [Pelistega ratti]